MWNQFLAGEDTDFDYSTVDDNDTLDPASVDQDLEDSYFNDEDDGGDGDKDMATQGEYDYWSFM